MKYIYIVLVVLLCGEVFAAEKNLLELQSNQESLIFREDTSCSLALNVRDSIACILFLQRLSSSPVIKYAIAPVCQCRSILKGTREFIKELYQDKNIGSGFWLILCPDYINLKGIETHDGSRTLFFDYMSFAKFLSQRRHLNSFTHVYSTSRSLEEYNLTMTFDGSEITYETPDKCKGILNFTKYEPDEKD